MADSVQSPSKRPRLSIEEKHKNDIDRITDLPDWVLCHILSFLPTQDSVATTLLSKRWVDLWTQVPVLDFTDSDHHPLTDLRNVSWLLNFVHYVLLMSKAQSIRKFTLNWKLDLEFDVRYLRTWISCAVRRNIQELNLYFRSPQPHVSLPGNLFACKTHVSLNLAYEIFVDVPATVHLPCLRTLQLIGVIYANDDSLRRLLSSCPVLEDLTVSADNIVVLDINVPSVNTITVTRYSRGDIDPGSKLLIKAPMLERIDVKDVEVWDFLIGDASNLAEAIIEVFHGWSNDQFFKFLKDIANVRFLSLLKCTLWLVCCRWLVCPSEAKFPVFHNLVHLDIDCGCGYLDFLLALLKCSDNLKILVFRNVPFHCKLECDQALVESVPKCVSMSLKTLIFQQVYNDECDLKLLRYVLKNATFLKQMKIGISSRLAKRGRLLQNLLNYPRASVACEISFFFFDSSNEEIHL
ncbi:hypothetical protein REPUB_Repub04eG0041200 [Reevesia pubescens]